MAKIDEFEIVLRRKNSKYIAGIPQLGLFGVGESREAALLQLDRKKEQLEADLAEIDMSSDLDVTPILSSSTGYSRDALQIRGPSLLREVAGFSVKAIILVAVLSAGLAIGANAVVDNVRLSARGVGDQFARSLSANFQHVGGAGFWKKVLEDIDRLAERDMPPDQKQHLLTQIRTIVQKWRPFVAEGAKLFAVEQPKETGSEAK